MKNNYKKGELYGYDAMSSQATPYANRLRYLKRKLGTNEVVDGKTVYIDEAITEIIQYCVRIANKQLLADFRKTTNLISLSYPATYTFAQRQRLIELAEKATLEDGTKVKFWGTNFNGAGCFPEHDCAKKLAKRLAKLGINIVRFHQLDSEWHTPNIFAFTKGKRVTDAHLDPESMDRLDFLVKCLKDEGIYQIIVDPQSGCRTCRKLCRMEIGSLRERLVQ